MISFAIILAHGGGGHGPHDLHELLRAWEFDPLVIASLGIAAVYYARGLRKMWVEGGLGRGVKPWEAGCFALGWLSLFIALVSPLHPWGKVLFSAHMTQHEILMLVSAPLLILGRPMAVSLKSLPKSWARSIGSAANARWWQTIWQVVSGAAFAWILHAIVLWVWHVPFLFRATLRSDFVHALQHSSFLFSALLFWWAIMRGHRMAVAYGMAVLYMFTTAVHSGLLGVIITLNDRLWYPEYEFTTQSWGLTPLEDQQLGGLIMWIPAGLVYVIAGLAFMAGWMREAERRVSRQRFTPTLPASEIREVA
jgi:putative membrane protein